jgi:hypothetical protein
MIGVFLMLIMVHPSMAEYFVTPSNYWQLEQADPENDGILADLGGVDGICSADACPTQAVPVPGGIIGNAFLFDGIDDVVTFASNTIFDFAADADISIELWMKLDGKPSETQVLIGRDDANAANLTQWWVAVNTDGNASTFFKDSNGGSPASSLRGYSNVADNNWHHIAVVRNGGTVDTLQIYVDGVLENELAYTGADDSFASTSDVMLGNLPGSSTFWYGGLLDNVAVYSSSALSAAVIKQNYLNGLNSFDLDDEFTPVFSGDASETAVVGFPATMQAVAAGNPMPTYSSSDLPSGLVDATIDAAGLISWTPSDIQLGSNPFSVTATNSAGSSQSWSVTVLDLCTTALDAHWKLEADGGPYQEVTGTVADGAGGDVAPTIVATAKVGAGQSFSDGNAEIIIPANAVFDWGSGASFSIELWMRRDGIPTGGTEVMIGRDDDGSSTQWWLGVTSDGKAGAFFRDTDAGDSPGTLKSYSIVADDAWHHIMVVRDGTNDNMKIYVDGVLENVQDHSGDLTSTDQAFTIAGTTGDVSLGRLPNDDYYYGGLLDEIAIYNTTLSATVIAQHANPGADQFYCNEAPDIDSTEITAATEDTLYSYPAGATDPEGHDILWTLTAAPNGMEIVDPTSGVVTWTPTEGVLSGDVTILATDEFGATDSQSFTIAVTAVNDDPVITTTGTAATTATVGSEYTYAPVATDEDLPADTLTWSSTDKPADMSLNADTGEISWTPAAGSEGDVTFTLTVSDGNGGTASETLTITVSGSDDTSGSDTSDTSDTSDSSSGGGGGGGCFITSLY